MADETTPVDDAGAVKDDLLWLGQRLRQDGGFLSPLKFFAPKVEAGISKISTLSPGKLAALRATLDGYRATHAKVDQRSLLALYQQLKDIIPEGS